ncbi:MAG: hypothetical protein V3V81_08090 [Candidatus Bathyarchaeia archaeon]
MAFTDDFTGSDEQALEDRSGWTLVKDGASKGRVVSNSIGYRLEGGGSGDTYYICTDQGSADHYTQIKAVKFATRPEYRVCCRLVDEDNWIGWYLGGTGGAGSRLAKDVAGSITDLVTTQGANNDVIKVTCESNTIKFYIDDVQQGTDQTVTDHNTETSQGLVDSSGSAQVSSYDDFEAGLTAVPSFIPKVIMIN